jgi:hypothetical protein
MHHPHCLDSGENRSAFHNDNTAIRTIIKPGILVVHVASGQQLHLENHPEPVCQQNTDSEHMSYCPNRALICPQRETELLQQMGN